LCFGPGVLLGPTPRRTGPRRIDRPPNLFSSFFSGPGACVSNTGSQPRLRLAPDVLSLSFASVLRCQSIGARTTLLVARAPSRGALHRWVDRTVRATRETEKRERIRQGREAARERQEFRRVRDGRRRATTTSCEAGKSCLAFFGGLAALATLSETCRLDTNAPAPHAKTSSRRATRCGPNTHLGISDVPRAEDTSGALALQ
jgi:hypothetical protein